MPVISVIIPIFNVENYLGESLSSLSNQTFKDFEIICVNDGSTDKSLEVLQKYQTKDSRIKIINQENKGNGGARNTGLKNATGDYVYFFDADDILFPNALEKMYTNAISNDSDLVMFKISWLNEDSPLRYKPQLWPFDDLFKGKNFKKFTFTYKDIKHYVMNSGSFAVWAKFYKKEFLDQYENYFIFPEKTAFADVRFHVISLLLASKISFENEILYKYRLSNPNSVTNCNKNRMNIFNVVNSVEDFLNDAGFYEEFKNEFAKFKIYQLLHYIPSANSIEFFEKVREEFLRLDVSSLDLPKDYKGRYNLLLNSKDYSTYLHNLILYDERLNDKYGIISNRKEFFRLKNKNKSLEKENNNYKKLINAMESSKSWKITKPLRNLRNFKKNF